MFLLGHRNVTVFGISSAGWYMDARSVPRGSHKASRRTTVASTRIWIFHIPEMNRRSTALIGFRRVPTEGFEEVSAFFAMLAL